MSAPPVSTTCIYCERFERNGAPPRICYHLAGDPVDREALAREADRADIDDERQARRDRGQR